MWIHVGVAVGEGCVDTCGSGSRGGGVDTGGRAVGEGCVDTGGRGSREVSGRVDVLPMPYAN